MTKLHGNVASQHFFTFKIRKLFCFYLIIVNKRSKGIIQNLHIAQRVQKSIENAIYQMTKINIYSLNYNKVATLSFRFKY